MTKYFCHLFLLNYTIDSENKIVYNNKYYLKLILLMEDEYD